MCDIVLGPKTLKIRQEKISETFKVKRTIINMRSMGRDIDIFLEIRLLELNKTSSGANY